MSFEMTPSMDPEGLSFFKTSVQNSRCYLEYGCGGSTSYVAHFGSPSSIISVDTSLEWINKVITFNHDFVNKISISHCDLGEVGDWGTPIDNDKFKSFWTYMVLPWSVATERKLLPDLVLVDGRFRVASFLYSLISARVGTTIMFDDYFDRPQYFIVEKFCKLRERHGRMAVFTADHNYSVAEIVKCIAEYSVETK